jgi:glycosyltransferase involved in cell wall biosynthesis
MLYVDLPSGGHHGWGICGDNLSNAFAALTTIWRINNDPLPPARLPGPLLQSIGQDLRPHRPPIAATRRVGYAMFEDDQVARRTAAAALGNFDAIAAASRWGEQALSDAGLKTVVTIPQGIDTSLFHPRRAVRSRLRDRFVIFSGGKLELRKGQDIALRAFRRFSERHPDAFLVAAWHNVFPASVATMIASPYYPFTMRAGEPFSDALRRWVINAGLDPKHFELLPQLPNDELATVYGNSDVGLFPNRCEGATNLVLMEYMACGRPAIATDFSGHRDVLTDHNSLPLRAWRVARSRYRGEVIAHWCEPNIDEILERLESAYSSRDQLVELGAQAAADLSRWTWDRAALQFLSLLQIDPHLPA